jgi:hypothetical protein
MSYQLLVPVAWLPYQGTVEIDGKYYPVIIVQVTEYETTNPNHSSNGGDYTGGTKYAMLSTGHFARRAWNSSDWDYENQWEFCSGVPEHVKGYLGIS